MNREVKKKYKDVSGLFDDALDSAKSIQLEGQEENVELSAIRAALEKMNDSFKDEINKLESSSEWDKFCIAYFGETNAGKSTIIESLRIIYNEEKRFTESINQSKEFKTILEKHSEEYENLLKSLEDVNGYLQGSESSGSGKAKDYVKNGICALLIFIAGVILGILLF